MFYSGSSFTVIKCATLTTPPSTGLSGIQFSNAPNYILWSRKTGRYRLLHYGRHYCPQLLQLQKAYKVDWTAWEGERVYASVSFALTSGASNSIHTRSRNSVLYWSLQIHNVLNEEYGVLMCITFILTRQLIERLNFVYFCEEFQVIV